MSKLTNQDFLKTIKNDKENEDILNALLSELMNKDLRRLISMRLKGAPYGYRLELPLPFLVT